MKGNQKRKKRDKSIKRRDAYEKKKKKDQTFVILLASGNFGIFMGSFFFWLFLDANNFFLCLCYICYDHYYGCL
jgi:hypothetical protein